MLFNHDILIVGAGGAGLRAAYEIAKNSKLDLAVISKVHPLRSHTGAAQGGINAALNNNQSKGEDSVRNHVLETINGSDYLADKNAVEIMCQEGPEAIIELEQMGVCFSRDPEGKIAQRPFGGANFPRACYSADITGHVILHTLYEQVLRKGIKIYEEWLVIDLIVEDGICKGVLAIELRTGELNIIEAKAVILATGGAGRVYEGSTNALISTGDGQSLAYRAGIPLKDMEFVQFHPTTLAGSGIVITEGARGEGAFLLNKNNERFLKKYAPEKMELAGRDIVSRAEQTEINEGRGINGCVLLDLTHLGKEKIIKRLPQIRQLAINFAGVDCLEEPIPVKPGVHYMMGGIDTDENGKTIIEGLFAVGECACISVHGANRLGGNSLLETIVFGKRAGVEASRYVLNKKKFKIVGDWQKKEEEKLQKLFLNDKGEDPIKIRNDLQKIMSKNVGIFRKKEELEQALYQIKKLKEKYLEIALKDKEKIFNQDLVETLELRFLLDCAETIAYSALKREESRGSQMRVDFPKRDDENWLKHTLCYYGKNRDLEIKYKEIT